MSQNVIVRKKITEKKSNLMFPIETRFRVRITSGKCVSALKSSAKRLALVKSSKNCDLGATK